MESHLSLVKARPHLSTYGIIKESIKTTRRNGRLALSILVFVFLSSSQLELGGFLALRPFLEDFSTTYWPVREKVTCFGNRASVLVETPSSSSWEKRNIYYSYQRANNPSSNNGYTDQTKQVSNRTYSYQRAYPSLYNGYTGQTKQASSASSYQRAYPSSYNGINGYTVQTKEAINSKGANSYQRVYPSSYHRYTGQTNQKNMQNGAYSYQRTNPNFYGYKGQAKRMGEQKGAYSYQTFPAYGYTSETNGKGELKDFRAVLGIYALILTISCVILLFFLVATLSSSYEAYTAKVISLKDVFLKFRESWKRSIHTGIFLTLISSGFFLILVFLMGLISLFTEGSSTYVLYAILSIPGYICYVHLAALWMMSFAVSVLESDYSGLKAIVRGGELMRGKRRQAYLLIVLFNLANAGVNTISIAYATKLNKCANMSITMPFVIGMIRVIKFLMFVAFTVYYHERIINQEEEKVEGRVGFYVPVASDEV